MHITLKIDGYQVTSAEFAVLTQHNYVPTALSLSVGTHHVVASAGDGTMIEATFTVPTTGQRWGLLSYWASSAYYSPNFKWMFTTERFTFA